MMASATALVERFEKVLGRPISTPEFVGVEPGRYERALYRVFKFRCPACRAWWDDSLCRPLTVTSDGQVFCNVSWCSVKEIVAAIRELEVSS